MTANAVRALWPVSLHRRIYVPPTPSGVNLGLFRGHVWKTLSWICPESAFRGTGYVHAYALGRSMRLSQVLRECLGNNGAGGVQLEATPLWRHFCNVGEWFAPLQFRILKENFEGSGIRPQHGGVILVPIVLGTDGLCFAVLKDASIWHPLIRRKDDFLLASHEGELPEGTQLLLLKQV